MKTILITGCSSGIGKATAIYFANKGWNVVATMRTINSVDFADVSNITKVQLNVNDINSINSALEFAFHKFRKIDVLVNNAGYAAVGAFECASEEQIKKQFDVNVFGLMNVTKAILPYFRKNNSGTIINISSVAGHIPFPTFSIYNSTKFAVNGFSEALQYELKQFNIKVKIVEPGPIKTDFYSRSMDIFKSDITDYDKFILPTIENIKKSGNNGLLPNSVAKTIYKAANSKCNKIHYPVKFQAKAMLLLKKLIPNCFVRWIINKVITN